MAPEASGEGVMVIGYGNEFAQSRAGVAHPGLHHPGRTRRLFRDSATRGLAPPSPAHRLREGR
jgi:hypothetical protein